MSKTASMGDFTINAEGLSTEAIHQILDNLHRRREDRRDERFKRDIQHGHNFGFNRKCECGLSELEYRDNWREKQTTCQALYEYLKQNSKPPDWFLKRVESLGIDPLTGLRKDNPE